MKTETIAAIATPAGSGGIGIIKISGPESISAVAPLFHKIDRLRSAAPDPYDPHLQPCTPNDLESHRLYHGYIVQPESRQIIDEILLAVMRAPYSYTREDVVEIQAHASRIALKTILELILQNGVRLAAPGEFTKRAYLNGRIDLTQAEAVIDLINAKTSAALSMAANHLSGGMKYQIERIRDAALDLLAYVEAGIDFCDDIEDEIDGRALAEQLNEKVIKPIENLLQHYTACHLFRDGLRLAIVGRPNVGKSSLLNRLVHKERVIVAETPGTTRDPIEEPFQINGLPIIVIDTAGLHSTDDPVEKVGIRKADEYIQGADLVLFLIEAQNGFRREDDDIFKLYQDKPLLLVINKIDLVHETGSIEGALPGVLQNVPRALVSAKYNQGIDQLKQTIFMLTTNDCRLDTSQTIVPNLRHQKTLESGLKAARAAQKGLTSGTPFELIALDLAATRRDLDRIIGVSIELDVLDRIFSQFCIGK